ncbi:hypothetical protein [Solwaraspora sp. WMMD792]|uniref:hypothetical protein n=1 Tax=Solwaraspora sp. WMMD792 TaxID=3016099 RepID=UPI00241624AD|nr:hypothetical protein [Solwaraspora sp. WMMD792]MDG4769749.1 hypothetical protein [Solwaraspora sp. WMMD792]
MRTRLTRIAVGLLAVAALTFGLPPNPAMAVNQVGCGNRTDFLLRRGPGPGVRGADLVTSD